MNSKMSSMVPTVDADDLRPALEPLLNRHFGVPRRIIRLTHRPSSYHSSLTLEELEVCLEDGTTLQVMWKNLGHEALLEGARRIRPSFLYNPLREIEMYRTILVEQRLGSAICYGAVVKPSLGRYWLFLEKVPGVELYQVGEFAIWQQVAVWLSHYHSRFTDKNVRENLAPAAHLLIHTRDYYWLWMRRAMEFPGATTSSTRQKNPQDFDWLGKRYGQVVERLMMLPQTLIHGEFYASNILVHRAGDSVRVCPVDWEMAAEGPGLIDLAALTAGNWTDEEKTALALAYYSALEADGGEAPSQEDFFSALDCCRLHLAVRWLGWSPGWSPPPEHAQDWLHEALCLAEKLGL